jgi:hypothetical protein
MKPIRLLSVVCLVASMAIGYPVTYTFEITHGSLTIDVSPDGLLTPDPVEVAVGGTFAMTINTSNNQIGEGGSFIVQNANIRNTEQVVLSIASWMGGGTATVPVGSAGVLGFNPVTPGQIPAGGAATIETDVYVQGQVIISGNPLGSGTYSTSQWLNEAYSVDVTFNPIPVQVGQPFNVTLGGTFGYTIYIPDIGGGPELGQTLDVEARMIPEPALGGIIAMGVGGAGTWLRRRVR